MSGPVSPPLTVREADGTPSGRPINTIVVSNGDLSISGTIATIDTSGSGVPLTVTDGTTTVTDTASITFNSGSGFTVTDNGGGNARVDVVAASATLTDTHVGFGSSSNLLTGNSKFRYLESAGQLILTGTGDDNAELLIERSSGSTQTIGIKNDSSASPKVRVSVPPNNAKPLMLESHVTDTAVTGGSSGFIFNASNTADTSISMLTILTTDSAAYDVVFNEDSLNDYDIRMEGSTNQDLFFLDGSENRVGIGAQPDSGIFQIQGGNFVIGPSTIVGSSVGNPATMRGNTALFNFLSSNAASGDQVAGIRVFSDNFRARGMMIGKVDDITVDETVTEQYLIGTQYNKTDTTGISAAPENGGTEYLTVKGLGVAGSSSLVVNEDGIDMDFNVKGDTNANLVYVDGGQDNVGIGAAPASGGALTQIDVGNSTTRALDLISDDSDADAAPTLRFHRESSSPGVQDATGQIEFSGKDLAGNEQVYSTISSHIVDPSNTSEDGDLRFKVIVAGSEQEFLRMNNFGVIFNEIGIDQNFKIETVGNNKMFRVDGGLNMVSVGDDPSSTGAQFQVNDDASFKSEISNQNSTTILTSDQVKNSKIISNPSGSDATITLPAGEEGMRVTVVNVSASNTVTVAPNASDTFIEGASGTFPRAMTAAQLETWLCYKDNNWVLENFI